MSEKKPVSKLLLISFGALVAMFMGSLVWLMITVLSAFD